MAILAAGSMEAFLSNVNLFFTQSIDWLGEVLDVIVANPVLLIMVIAMPVVGFAVGLLGRLIRL